MVTIGRQQSLVSRGLLQSCCELESRVGQLLGPDIGGEAIRSGTLNRLAGSIRLLVLST